MPAMGRRPGPRAPHGLQDFTEAQVSPKAGFGTAEIAGLQPDGDPVYTQRARAATVDQGRD